MPENDVERSPDKQPSHSRLLIKELDSNSVLCVMEVKGLGALVFRGFVAEEQHGVALFTDEEIKFD